MTGLTLINGGGGAEVDAAHVRPYEGNGPDILSNGIVLSGTARWMFDRRLSGLSDGQEQKMPDALSRSTDSLQSDAAARAAWS